jgi:pimeloyl-ACP methyl ester carboxylesterase
VIFETFGHTSGYSWIGVQPEVAKLTRACWYDRAGYGWSEPGPMPATYQSVVTDLHALLHAAKIPGPYVLVGASEAALHIRMFNGLYPGEVGGAVLMNALDVDAALVAVPEDAKGPWARHFGSFAPRVRGTACLALPTMARVGVFRLAGMFSGPRGTPALGFPPDQQAELDDLSDNPTAARGGEACNREEGMEQVRAAPDLGDRPLIVLFAPDRSFPSAWKEAQIDQVQPRIAKLSSRGRFTLVEQITPATVVSAIKDVMGELAAENRER